MASTLVGWLTLLIVINSDAAFLACYHDTECDVSVGERCVFEYDGCSQGECRCHPSSHKLVDSTCVPLRYGGETCTENIQCPTGIHCVRGICACAYGQLSPDRMYCIREYHRMLSESCAPREHTCLQYRSHQMGYQEEGVGCFSGRCRCEPGFKTQEGSCVPFVAGERGCQAHYHCTGGARCDGGICRCPPGYTPTADGQKCAPSHAKTHLSMGEMCDELHGNSYCGYGLVCHQCPRRSSHTCVRHEITTRRQPQASTSSAPCTHQGALYNFIFVGCVSTVCLARTFR